MTRSHVVAISGITGAGKSTLSSLLAKELNATLITWDDFDSISKSPDDFVEWYNKGQDYSVFDYETLANVLQVLSSGDAIEHPIFHNELKPTKYIIFDAPLGRLHKQTGQYINTCVHIEVPLDVSLVRRTLRDFRRQDKTKEDILEDLEFYLQHSRPLFFDDDLKRNADLIIDGMLTTEEQKEIIKKYLKLER